MTDEQMPIHMTDEEIAEQFGDINDDGSDARIEEWEAVDQHLADRYNMTEHERRDLWRALDPDTPLHDWYDDLRRQGHDDEEARQIITETCDALAD